MLNSPPAETHVVEYDSQAAPRLIVVVDTEEEFPWHEPHARAHTSVQAMQDIHLGQDVCHEFGLIPTYVIDFPVASQPEGFTPLLPYAERGECVVGAHLHPWVTPPFDEVVCAFNSFPGNLERELEASKLHTLSTAIEQNFDRPRIYKAGRYGVGAHTADILHELGYQVDLSPTPGYSYANERGPDFTRHPASPYVFGEYQDMLCIPCTGGFTGMLKAAGRQLYPLINARLAQAIKLGGISSRLSLLERIRLSPEGFSLQDLMKITRTLLQQGVRTFTLSYHSPTLRPGCTPYVENAEQLTGFLTTMRNYFEFFFNELNGVAATPESIYKDLQGTGSAPHA